MIPIAIATKRRYIILVTLTSIITGQNPSGRYVSQNIAGTSISLSTFWLVAVYPILHLYSKNLGLVIDQRSFVFVARRMIGCVTTIGFLDCKSSHLLQIQDRVHAEHLQSRLLVERPRVRRTAGSEDPVTCAPLRRGAFRE